MAAPCGGVTMLHHVFERNADQLMVVEEKKRLDVNPYPFLDVLGFDAVTRR